MQAMGRLILTVFKIPWRKAGLLTMIKWIRTIRLSIKNSLYAMQATGRLVLTVGADQLRAATQYQVSFSEIDKLVVRIYFS